MATKRRRRRVRKWIYSFILRLRMVFGAAPVTVPAAVTGVSAVADLNGTIIVFWTLPAGVTQARVRYSVDQAAAPAAPYLGIDLGIVTGSGVVLTGVEYGATYRFAVWGYGPGGHSLTAGTASATGPFNPSAYRGPTGALVLWLDARREPVQSDNTDIVPDDLTGAQTVTAATAPPHYRTSGINGLPSFEGYNAASGSEIRGLLLGTVNLDGADGLTVASLVAVNDAATSSLSLASKWDTAGDQRGWQASKTGGEWIFNCCATGLAGDVVNVQTASADDTDPHGLVFTYEPGTALRAFVDGAMEGETTTSVPSTLFHSATEDTRIMLSRHAAGDGLRGQICIKLAYSAGLSRTASELLSDHLAAIGGV